MGQGSGLLVPFGMPEGGWITVDGIGGCIIATDHILAIDGHDAHLLLGNEATDWRGRRECHAYLVGGRAFRTGTVIVLNGKVIGLSCG